MSIRAVTICVILLSPFILAASAAAQTYPTRPIRLVIPYPPGGVQDAIGRGIHVSCDPIGSFDAVSILGHITQAIAVNPSLPVRTLKELADYAKRNPGKLSYRSPGVGSLNHLTGERFKLLIGSPDIVHVPYRGAGPAITDLIGGQIPMAIPAVNGQLLAHFIGHER